MAEAALGATQWAVGKALAPVMDTVLDAWGASRNFTPNIEALRDELLRVKATLENAGRKEIGGPAMEELLQRLRDAAHNAEDLLDELDYFRIHDELRGKYDAADQHGKGCICDLVCDVHHTAKALGKQLASLPAYCFGANAGDHRQGDARQHVRCYAWQRGRQGSRGDSSSSPNANQADQDQEVSGCMPKLGKLFTGSSSPHPHVGGDEDRGNVQETPMLEFNRVEFSQRMKGIVEKLQPARKDVNKILHSCGPKILLDIAQHRPTTTPQSAEPKLYGRDCVMNSIIHDITEAQYCDKVLNVLPVIGPGGIGKTTMIQHIYNNQQVQNHFPVTIWICVSFNFSLGKVLEQIKSDTLPVEGENGCSTTQELIEHRLKYRRFLLVLDDIWQFTDLDDWKKLLLILGKSQEKGSMILVTTRQKEIAAQVKKTVEPKELDGLEPGEFRKLFLVYVFDAEQYPGDKLHLLDTGDKIMEKLKGSPLAGKTVGRLLSKDLSLPHWRRVLNNKEWETDNNGIMSALKLSYDFLPFNLQRCFFYSALFPEDYRFKSRELISLWVGLDILAPCGPTFEDGLRILNDLVIYGFFREEETDGDSRYVMHDLFREEETDGDSRYVMHDLLHELALKVASHDCLSLRLPNVGPVNIQPTTRHLSIGIEDLSGEELKSELEKLKTILNIEHLQTLMLFGKMNEGFVKIFGDFLGEANALRVLHFPSMLCPVESMIPNVSGLVHLRYLCLGPMDIWSESQIHLPLSISKFYHLRILVLDLKLWNGRPDLPKDMSNLAKLCHFYTPSDGELHSDICNVGKLKLLEELKVFRVNKREEGFGPKELEHLTKLRELGIYNLEKIPTEEEAAQAKLIEKKYLRKLTLDWDSKRSSLEPGVEAAVLEGLQPHEDLEVLCIRGHGGHSCPTWLGDEFAVEALQSFWLGGVSWEVFPSLGKALDLRELSLEDIAGLKELILEKSFCKLKLRRLGSFEKWGFPAEQESSLVGDLLPPDAHMFPLLQELIIMDCPKLLGFPFSNRIVSPDWFPKLQELEICDCPEFLAVIPMSLIESLRRVLILRVKLLEVLDYSKSSDGVELIIVGMVDLHSMDQVLDFDKETGLEKLIVEKCPPLQLKHLRMLTSLKTLFVQRLVSLVGPLGGEGDAEWQLPVEDFCITGLSGNSGKELTELLPHLPKLSKLTIKDCENIKKLVVGVDVQQTTSEASEMGGGEITAATEEQDEEDEITTSAASEMGGGEITAATEEQDEEDEITTSTASEMGRGEITAAAEEHDEEDDITTSEASKMGGGEITAASEEEDEEDELTTSEEEEDDGVLLFPAHLCDSLQELDLLDCRELVLVAPPTLVPGRGWLEALRSLQRLSIRNTSPFSFSCHMFPSSLQFLTVTRGHPHAAWDPNPGRALEQQTRLVSSTLQDLYTDYATGLLSAPVCSFFSSSLTRLVLRGSQDELIECFNKEQEDALQLLSSLQHLVFFNFNDLEQLPAGLHNLTRLKILTINRCPGISSLPNDGLPDSLQELNVKYCFNEELKQHCSGLVGTIPKITL